MIFLFRLISHRSHPFCQPPPLFWGQPRPPPRRSVGGGGATVKPTPQARACLTRAVLGGARRGACRELSGRRGAAGGGGALPARGAQVTRPPPARP